jgi:ribosome-associated protein
LCKEATLGVDSSVEATTLARLAVDVAEDRQATDIVMLDLRKLNTIADYFVVCSGDNERQLRAILDAIHERIQTELGREARIEGTPGTGWILLDYGDVVVHIFSIPLRDYYRIERLWSKATPVVVVQ